MELAEVGWAKRDAVELEPVRLVKCSLFAVTGGGVPRIYPVRNLGRQTFPILTALDF